MAINHIKKFVMASTVSLILLVAGFGLFGCSSGKPENVTANGDVVPISTSNLADGKARFYKFVDGGKEIAFFAVKTPDGSYKTAFDACDSCFRDRKGYEQQGDMMNCKNCNQKFAISRLGPNATGGCNPGYLPSKSNGNFILISLSDLKNGARYF